MRFIRKICCIVFPILIILFAGRDYIGIKPVILTRNIDTAISSHERPDHNCRLWGAIAYDFPESLIYNQLVADPYSLKNLASDFNVDGWGIADYMQPGAPADIARGGVRAYTDTLYDMQVESLEASDPRIILAHIRNCSSGCCCQACDSIPDPHPYMMVKNGRTWTFAHNGAVSKSLLYDLIDENYLQDNPPTGSGIPECDPADTTLIVDSELYFIYLMEKIEEAGWNVSQGLAVAINTIIINGPGSALNFLLSDGYNLWAFKKGMGLYYVYDPAHNYSAAASQVPSAQQGLWQEVEDFELVEMYPSDPPNIIDISSFLPDGFYVPGDANGNLTFNGLDVTYSFNYLKGDGPAPPDSVDCPGHGLIAAAADANGSCSFNGLDVTYCIDYFRGTGSPPIYCADCPPDLGGIRPDTTKNF